MNGSIRALPIFCMARSGTAPMAGPTGAGYGPPINTSGTSAAVRPFGPKARPERRGGPGPSSPRNFNQQRHNTMHTLKELLIDELRDLYDAEQRLVTALPKMAKAAGHEELREGFAGHLDQTKGHVNRLERAFELLSARPSRKTCPAMKGLIEEGGEAIASKAPGPVRDARLIGAAQRVEHYEIAAYGTARAFAEVLEEDEVAGLLQATLEEERATDEKLTAVAETVNARALNEGGEM